jgi:hypothetical protein
MVSNVVLILSRIRHWSLVIKSLLAYLAQKIAAQLAVGQEFAAVLGGDGRAAGIVYAAAHYAQMVGFDVHGHVGGA